MKIVFLSKGDRDKFLKVYVEELNKADDVIDEMTKTNRKHSVNDQRSDEDKTVMEDLDDKIEKVLEKFKDSDPLERT